MAETKAITKYLKKDIDKTNIISYITLAFGISGTVGSAASIEMQLSKSDIQFAAKGAASAVNPGTGAATGVTKSAGVFFRGIWTKIRAWFKGDGYIQVPTLHAEVLSVRTATNIDSVIEWYEEDDELLKSIIYECEEDNPQEASLSVQSTYEVCH